MGISCPRTVFGIIVGAFRIPHLGQGNRKDIRSLITGVDVGIGIVRHSRPAHRGLNTPQQKNCRQHQRHCF